MEQQKEETKKEEFISLAKVVKEMYGDRFNYKSKDGHCNEKSIQRTCSRAFKKNLNALLGDDYSGLLMKKSKGTPKYYMIPVKSKEFVKSLIEPDEELLQVIEGKMVYEGIGVLDTINKDSIKEIVSKDTILSKVRFNVYILFENATLKRGIK